MACPSPLPAPVTTATRSWTLPTSRLPCAALVLCRRGQGRRAAVDHDLRAGDERRRRPMPGTGRTARCPPARRPARSGCRSSSAAAFSAASTMSAVSRVRIRPGQIALTRMRSWPERDGHRPGQRQHGALGGGVGVARPPARRLEGRHRRRVDDRAAAGRPQVRDGGLADQVHRAHVDVLGQVPVLQVDRLDGAADDQRPDAGVVEQDVEPADASTAWATAAAHCSGCGQVGDDRRWPTPGRPPRGRPRRPPLTRPGGRPPARPARRPARTGSRWPARCRSPRR